jgi:hypothetical protein
MNSTAASFWRPFVYMDRVSVTGDAIVFGSASPSILPILLVLPKLGIEERAVGGLQENWGGKQ